MSPTFRDDLARVGNRLLEIVQERAGQQVVPQERMQLLESTESEARMLRKTLDLIGFQLFNYQGPTPFELNPTARWYTYAQALKAWVEDPLVGDATDLYLSFVFGSGVPRPQAHDDEVQTILDNTWDDPANQLILTSYPKLLEKGIDYCLESNVFFTINDGGEDGRVALSLLRFQDVQRPIRHPKNHYRILWYECTERVYNFDFVNGTYQSTGEAPAPKTVYYEVHGAFDPDNAAMAAEDEGLKKPPPGMLRPGEVVPLQANKTSEMAFGVPRIRRVLRWATAYNNMIESHVNRMKAMASVYMTATARGDQGQLNKLAMMARGRTSAFGSGARDEFGEREFAGPIPGGQPLPPEGPGILTQNESMQWAPFKVDSGASDVATGAPIVRGQAGGPWPDHYLSGSANGQLAGTQAMELPTLKFVEMEQSLWKQPFDVLGDAAIDRAIAVGDLTEWRDPTEEELRRIEASVTQGTPLDSLEYDKETGLVKRDLGFEVSLPNPLKRAMGDIVAAAVEVAQFIDPQGQIPEMKRWLFGYTLSEAFRVQDPMRIVDEVLPRKPDDDQPEEPAAAPGLAPPPEDLSRPVGPDGDRHPPENPNGAPMKSPQPEDRRVQEAPDPVVPANAVSNGNGRSASVQPRVKRAMAAHHSGVLEVMTPKLLAAVSLFFAAQRARMLAAVHQHASALEQTPDPASVIWDQAAEDQALTDVFMPVIDEIGSMTLDDAPAAMPRDIGWNAYQDDPLVASVRDQLAFRVTGINETTRSELASVLDQGLRAGYTPEQIAAGVAGDGYKGMLGVFDGAIGDRANLIATTETANAYNAVALAGYQSAGVELVTVSDGDGCETCAITDGAIWTVDDAAQNLIEHPNCVRSFSPAPATADNLALVEAPLGERKLYRQAARARRMPPLSEPAPAPTTTDPPAPTMPEPPAAADPPAPAERTPEVPSGEPRAPVAGVTHEQVMSVVTAKNPQPGELAPGIHYDPHTRRSESRGANLHLATGFFRQSHARRKNIVLRHFGRQLAGSMSDADVGQLAAKDSGLGSRAAIVKAYVEANTTPAAMAERARARVALIAQAAHERALPIHPDAAATVPDVTSKPPSPLPVTKVESISEREEANDPEVGNL